MATYKLAKVDVEYTYQDWVDGKPMTNGLPRDPVLRVDYLKILDIQEKAFQHYIENELERQIMQFIFEYGQVYLKKKFLEDEINIYSGEIEEAVEEDPEIYNGILYKQSLFEDLTYKDVQEIYSENENSDFALRYTYQGSPLFCYNSIKIYRMAFVV